MSILLYVAGSIWMFKKPKQWLVLAFISSILIKLSYALALPYLGMWDEQFHALVAKNMLSNPFHPKLFVNKSIETSADNWSYYTTWLHKQPFFMWCIALSYKMFGVNIITLRLPSVLLSSTLVFPVYKLGKALKDELTGIIAVTLLVFNHYFNTMHNGSIPTDHNDIFFTSLICWGFYTSYLYTLSEKFKHLFLTTIICGLAVLTKWLVGLLPLAYIWIYFLINKKHYVLFKSMIIGLVLTAAVFMPWQIYCYINFKNVFLHEMSYNALHIKEVVEGHDGGGNYHLVALKKFIGYNYLILVGLILSGIVLLKDYKKMISCFFIIVVVHLFFLMVKTKMDNFTLVLLPLYLLLISIVLVYLTERLLIRIKFSGISHLPLIIIMIVIAFNPSRMSNLINAPAENYNHKEFVLQKQLQAIAKSLDKSKRNIVVNCSPVSHPVLMLHSNCEAYSFLPDSLTLSKLNAEGCSVINAFKQ